MKGLLAMVLLALASATAVAQYSDECRDLARRMAVEPGSLNAAELDLVRDCVASLQRALLLGEAVAPGEPLACPEVPSVPVDCPFCPASSEPVCARATPAPAPTPAARARDKAREGSEDRRPRTYIPKY